jgi:hypothetical protein
MLSEWHRSYVSNLLNLFFGVFSNVCFFQVGHNLFIFDNLHVEVAFKPTDQKYSHMWLVVYLIYNNMEIFFEPQGIQVQSNGKHLYFKCFSEERVIQIREFPWMKNCHSPLNADVKSLSLSSQFWNVGKIIMIFSSSSVTVSLLWQQWYTWLLPWDVRFLWYYSELLGEWLVSDILEEYSSVIFMDYLALIILYTIESQFKCIKLWFSCFHRVDAQSCHWNFIINIIFLAAL